MKRSGNLDMLSPLLWISAVLLLAAYLLRKQTDVHLTIDPVSRVILQNTRFMNHSWTRRLIAARSIAAIGVRPVWRKGKGSQRWEYQVVLVGHDGRVIPLSLASAFECKVLDEVPSDAEFRELARLNETAQLYALILQCPAFQGMVRRALRLKRGGGTIEFHFCKASEPVANSAVTYTIALGCVFAIFLIWELLKLTLQN